MWQGGTDGAGSVPPAWPELVLLLLLGAECKEALCPYVGKLGSNTNCIPHSLGFILYLVRVFIQNWLAFASSPTFPFLF